MGETSAKRGVEQLKQVFLERGVRGIVFSPGSRNAPLVVAFHNDDRFEKLVIPDERSAAFYALGMAEQWGVPVAVMCTSGSALLNYYPAVSEAFYRNIPLLVVSADRPLEWTDQGDGQTIRQTGVFRNHIAAETQLFEHPQHADQEWWNRREANRVIQKAAGRDGGPAHINFPFREPLYETRAEEESFHSAPVARYESPKAVLHNEQQTMIENAWRSHPRKLIICGQLPPNPVLQQKLKQLAKDKSVAIVVENTSNLQDPRFIHCIDRTINSFLDEAPAIFQPDLLITMGGAVISKKIKKYLRSHGPQMHWKIGTEFPMMDTYQHLSHTFPMAPETFVDALLNDSLERDVSRYGEQWKQLDYQVQALHDDYFRDAPYADLSVFELLMDVVPDNSVLHLANSSVVRYAQLFNPVQSIQYYCNRGTSGIDGSLSTAIGGAIAKNDRMHTLIVGDLSFFYDSNALWNNFLPSNVRIFLINNGGGGIFSIIPGPHTTPAKKDYFVTSNNADAESICRAFDVNYYGAKNMEEIENQLQQFYEHQEDDRPAVMEIYTPEEENAEVLKTYFEKTKVSSVVKLDDE